MNKDLVVTKANKLVEASYRLNVSEQRVLALLVTQIHPDDEEFKPYRFKVAELAALIETRNNKAYREVQELTLSLIKKGLQIREPNKLVQMSWLSSATYYEGKGTVELKFAPEMKPYLLRLQERFTSYKLANVVKLRSRYSVRLYELLKQYESLGKRSFELVDLRRILGLSDSEFVLWNDFKRFVLERALRELPKKTDLGFSYTVRKRARAVAFVDFKIWHVDHDKPPKKSKPNGSSPTAKQTKQPKKKRERNTEAGPTAKQVKQLTTKAKQCWEQNNGTCAATWADHQKATDVCHWCCKFEKTRLEAAGQIRLPGT